jgi:hypothetical protein
MQTRNYLLKLGLVFTLCIYSLIGHASISPPVIPVANRTDALTFNVDKRAVPNSLFIWRNVSGGEGSTNPVSDDDKAYYAGMSWVCLAANNDDTGACPSYPQWSIDSLSSIKLRFVEKKTLISKTLDLRGYNFSYSADQSGVGYAIYSPRNSGLTGPRGKKLSLYILGSEISKLPIGGVWQAKLILRQSSWAPTSVVATWTANITINLVDSNNIQIYLPDYNTATPTIDLGLKAVSAGVDASLTGRADVQACLYDGFNGQSDSYTITMSDPSSKDSNFYIKNSSTNTNSDLENKIRYDVYTSSPAAPSDISYQRLNGVGFVFRNINGSTVPRLTSLPNIPNPVYCTPWQFSLIARIPRKEVESGMYSGVLRIKFTPSTANF